MSAMMKQYKMLEARVRKGDLDALLARWEFGRKLLEERGDAKRLPNGRREQLSNALGISTQEINARMAFAERCPTEAKVRAAFKEFGSWRAICAGSTGDRPADLESGAATASVADLKPHPQNYKEHPEDQIEQIAASIAAVGFVRDVVVARNNTILAGHGVWMAARRLGITQVPVKRLALDPSEPKALKLLSGDNEIGSMAIRDDRKLTDMLKPLMAGDGLEGSGFDNMQLAGRVFLTRRRDEVGSLDDVAESLGIDYQRGDQKYRLTINFRNAEDREQFVKLHEIEVTRTNTTGKDGTHQSAWWPPSPPHDRTSMRWDQDEDGRLVLKVVKPEGLDDDLRRLVAEESGECTGATRS